MLSETIKQMNLRKYVSKTKKVSKTASVNKCNLTHIHSIKVVQSAPENKEIHQIKINNRNLIYNYNQINNQNSKKDDKENTGKISKNFFTDLFNFNIIEY